MKHPILRVASVLDIDESFIDELETLGHSIISCLPAGMVPVDFELCGSYANGGARLHSDIDLALPMKDWNEQILLRRMMNDRMRMANDIRNLTAAFGEKWGGVKLDFNPVVPDNKETAVRNHFSVYSIFERKIYGAPADFYNWYIVLEPYTQRYTMKRYDLSGAPVYNRDIAMPNLQPMRWAYDEWEADGTTAVWRAAYGDKFLEAVKEVKPDGTTELREF